MPVLKNIILALACLSLGGALLLYSGWSENLIGPDILDKM